MLSIPQPPPPRLQQSQCRLPRSPSQGQPSLHVPQRIHLPPYLHQRTSAKGTLGVHQVKLVVKTSPRFGNGGCVGEHADGTLDLGQIAAWNNGGWLVVDADLETGWAPVDELNRALGLDSGNGGVDILGNDITTVQQTAGHVLSVAGVTLNHLVGGFKARVGNLSDGELFVVGLFSRDDWGVGHQWKVDTWVRHQVGLEFSQVDIEGTIETKGGRDRGNNLSNQSVQVGVGWTLNVQVTTTDVVNGFVVNHEGTVRVLQSSVGGQNGVVWFDNSSRDLWGRVNRKLQLGLFAVVDGQTLQEESTKTGTSSTTERMEHQETLETRAVVGELADTVKNEVDNFLSDGVVTTGIVVGSIFLAGDELFRVKQLAVGTSADFVDDSGLQVDKDGTGNVLTSTSLREESVERVVTSTDGLVRRHLTIGLDTVFKTVELPAGVTDLDTGLTDVDRNTFSHVCLVCLFGVWERTHRPGDG